MSDVGGLSSFVSQKRLLVRPVLLNTGRRGVARAVLLTIRGAGMFVLGGMKCGNTSQRIEYLVDINAAATHRH